MFPTGAARAPRRDVTAARRPRARTPSRPRPFRSLSRCRRPSHGLEAAEAGGPRVRVPAGPRAGRPARGEAAGGRAGAVGPWPVLPAPPPPQLPGSLRAGAPLPRGPLVLSRGQTSEGPRASPGRSVSAPSGRPGRGGESPPGCPPGRGRFAGPVPGAAGRLTEGPARTSAALSRRHGEAFRLDPGGLGDFRWRTGARVRGGIAGSTGAVAVSLAGGRGYAGDRL